MDRRKDSMARSRILMASRGVVPIDRGIGGAELVVFQLARLLAAQGHQVTVVSDVGKDSWQVPNVDFVPVGSRLQRLVKRMPGGFFGWLIQHLIGNITATMVTRRLLRERDYDVIHAHGNLSAILLSFRRRAPIVYTEHDAPPWLCRYRHWWERGIRKALYRVLNVTAFRRVDHVAATFQALGDHIVDHWGVPRQKVSTILNGADAELFTPSAKNALAERAAVTREPAEAEPAHAVPFDSYCLFVGRLTPRKAPDLLLRAVARTADVNCVFAGDGPMRGKLERLANALGIEDRVAFLGNVDPAGLADLYSCADLLVHPSVSETTPLVLMEAMHCGTPVLATRIAGVPALVEDWETGFLVRPGDLGELAVALRFMMRDEELRQRMSHAAHERVVERQFLWPAVSASYERLYAELAGNGDGTRSADGDGAAAERAAEPELPARPPRRFERDDDRAEERERVHAGS